jgi:hypothetical protein
MANTKISNLPSAGALAGTEPLPIVQGGATVQTTVQDIANLAGGNQTLNDVLVVGNETLGTNIKVNDADAIELENASLLKKGTYDFGGLGGISRICGVGYEDMWQSGIHHVFDNMGFLRESTNCFNLIPDANFDVNLRFQVGSRWILDDGTLYVCADATSGAAVWDLISNVPNLQEVTDEGSTTTNSITAADVYSQSGTSQVATLTNGDIVYTPDTTAPTNKTVLDFGFPTATNTITLQDGSGTVAFLSDIPSGGGSIPHATASGTDTYTATISGVTAYNDGDAYLIRFPNGNTTGATLNINSIGAIDLYRNNDGLLIGGDIIAGGEMLCIYNSTTNAFQLIGTAPNTLLAYVTNADSVSITKGMPVYAFGGTGDRMTVKRALNTSDATSAQTIGIVLSTSIAANQKGIIIIQGQLDGLSIVRPADGFADGDPIYLGATAGSITNVKPSAPNHLVYLGVVTTASNGSSGRMYVRVQNGYELDELHDVSITSVADNQVLQYDSATSLWKNETLAYLSNSLIAYSFWANNTNATANATANTFKAIAKQTYSGTITWTGTTAPSGATQHSYSWQQVGNVVTFTLCLLYATQGGALTQVLMTLPSDMPSPVKPDGISATNDVICMLVGQLNAANTISANQHRASLRIDASSTSAFQLAVNAPSAGNHKSVWISGTYLTA